MRILAIFLMICFVAIQYPLWFGRGGVLDVLGFEHSLREQHQINSDWLMRNSVLEAEIQDLRKGGQAVEERARYNLGLIRSDETFVQIDFPEQLSKKTQ